MPDDGRFLLGYGERLTARVAPPGSGNSTEPSYSFDEAVTRLRPMVTQATTALRTLPALACPNDEAVGVVTLHPQWMSKSAHPQQLLNEYNLRQVGSRPVDVTPEKWTRQGVPGPAASSELFVAGSRRNFEQWAADLATAPTRVSAQIQQLETVRAPEPTERLRNVDPQPNIGQQNVFEIVLHASASERDQVIVSGFEAFAESVGAQVDLSRRLHAGGLCFVPVVADPDILVDLARFAFLRVARPIPRLRGVPTIERSVPQSGLAPCPLPTEDAVDTDLRIAVFDGGLDDSTPLARWATGHEVDGVGKAVAGAQAHGHDVTSAVLFGSLQPGQPAPRPYGVVDHFRVLDEDVDDPYDLYNVLSRINAVLSTRQHHLVNLSIGPDLPIEDDDVHPWTALLDEYLSDGETLLTVAVGNTGQRSESRIQVPSDCVNALAVGAADSERSDWCRADFSSVGPGRSPGVIKPDVVAFGGDGAREQFLVYDPADSPALASTAGTSFASPSTLRMAAGIRAHFGARVGALALKALLIHTASTSTDDKNEIGWGRVASDLESIVVCQDGMVRVLYQGELNPSQYLRAPVPLPATDLTGMITIEATFCFATPVDPQDPGAYTRSGLEVTFRPHANQYSSDSSTVPKTASFFRKNALETEQTLRNDAQKWETTLHATKKMRSSSLMQPVFDVHYNARESGGLSRSADRIRYALALTIRARRVPDLYDQVVRAYAGQLEALAPVVSIPIHV